MATLRHVATSAGVSQSVASRVLNDDTKARINPETAARVKAAARRLKYVPNYQARAFRASRVGTIGLIVPTVNNAVFADLFAGVQSTAINSGMTVLLGEMGGSSENEHVLTDVLRQGRIDGAILQRPENVDDSTLRDMLQVGQPVVLFNSTLARRRGSVTLPDKAAGRLATEHLIDLGHRRIGYVGGTTVHDAAKRRHAGFRAAMRDSGRRIYVESVVHAGWESAAGVEAARSLLTSKRQPTAIVVASVNAAVGVVSEALRQGRRVPEDLSVVTIQDTWVAEIYNPALTVVRMPLRQAGEVATNMLIAALSGQAPEDVQIDTPPELVVRASTGPMNCG